MARKNGLLIIILMLTAFSGMAQQESLVERLGFAPDAKVLIINGDDFGMNHATNTASIRALKCGGITSATIMVPCPWFLEAAAFARQNPEYGLGVHLTLTSEWKYYRWGPVSSPAGVPGLCDDLGFFYHDVPEVYLSTNAEELDKECRAQIDLALKAGVDVSHIDSHMGTMQYAPGYHKLYIDIAKDYNLPCRIASYDLMSRFGAGYVIEYADEKGVLHPDELIKDGPHGAGDTARYWKECIDTLKPGRVTEILIHCGEDVPEMRATTGSWRQRQADTEYFASPETRAYLKEQHIQLISYRHLRYLQRNGKPMPAEK